MAAIAARSESLRTAARGVAAVGVVVALIGMAGACRTSAADDADPEQRSFSLSGRSLTVDSDDSELEIVASGDHEEGKIGVTRWFEGSVAVGEDPRLSWELKGNRLELRTKCPGLLAHCSAKHRIEVPRGVAVKVVERDGAVRASGFREELDISTADGAVRVEDSSGPLRLHTQDGSVRADVSSRRVRVEAEDGAVNLDLEAVPELVEVRSLDGSVQVRVPEAEYRVDAGSRDGDVTVDVPRDGASRHVVKAHSDDGKVTVRTAN